MGKSTLRNYCWSSIVHFVPIANFRGDMIHCYHQPCDNLEVMLTEDNIRFLGKTADSITKTLDRLSEPLKSQGNISDVYY